MEILSRGSTFMDDEAVLGRLPGKFRKKLLLAMYRPQLIQCPLFLGLDDSIITKLAIVMCSYLALDGDHVVQEDSVGDEMYMVVRGEVTLKSKSAPLVNGKTWVDGAFFGESPAHCVACSGPTDMALTPILCRRTSAVRARTWPVAQPSCV
jgi:hypothetical protein